MNRAQQVLNSSYKAAGEKYPPVALSMAAGARWNMPDGSQYEAQATLYQKLTWVSTAIDFVAAAAAVLDFNVKELTGEDTVDIDNHDFEQLLRKPNPSQSRFEFLRDYFSYRRLTGNVYVYLNRPNAEAVPSEMWIIPTQKIKPVLDGKSYIHGYVFQDNGETIALEPWQVMHDKAFNPFTQFVGMSGLESLTLVSRGDIAQQMYSTKLFDKDNAKIPGALAFADFIENGQWKTLQDDTNAKWGGMNRSGPLWLRGVGAGGVQWVPMALSQKDMEFIAQRQMTKEEIYGKLAPGLASVLAINATEANALAGKAILAEYALWPMLVQAAEKMTKDILPAYGENLVGEFDDPRKSDRLVDLQEQELYQQTHTVNEVRTEYYGEDEVEGGDVPVAKWSAAPAPLPPGQTDSTNSIKPMDDLGGNTENVSASAEVMTEMKAWENFALRRLGKQGGREFEPRAIPLLQAARIKSELANAATPDAIKSIFSIERGDVDVAVELKRANDLLEKAMAK